MDIKKLTHEQRKPTRCYAILNVQMERSSLLHCTNMNLMLNKTFKVRRVTPLYISLMSHLLILKLIKMNTQTRMPAVTPSHIVFDTSTNTVVFEGTESQCIEYVEGDFSDSNIVRPYGYSTK